MLASRIVGHAACAGPRRGLRAWAVWIWLAGGLAGVCPLPETLSSGELWAAEPAVARIDFNRDVRPILSDRCFTCHGPDAEDRQADLRLDLRTQAVADLPSGTVAIVPGKPAASALMARVTSHDPETMMPPPHVGKPVTAAEAEILARWIAEGAEYRGHWAFEQVHRPALPAVKDQAWPKTPIDRFILARLEQEGLTPSPEADRVTLARRVSLDLTGLPPTPAEVETFVADGAADAFERYVDAKLASPHFGERMAVDWLDAARYADSNGFQSDSSRYNWPWRDWVIAAYNRNLPFDQFTVAQLAGDLLPNATPDQIVATGFNRNHRLNGEGGLIDEEWRVETVIDRVETTGQTWLGLTVGCARCHDHKYDPLTQREFYALFAFFNSIDESGTLQGDAKNTSPTLSVPSASQAAELARLEQLEAAAEGVVKLEIDTSGPAAEAWADALRAQLAAGPELWRTFEPLELSATGGASFRRSEDGSWYVEGANPPQDTYVLGGLLPAEHFSGLRLEVLPDSSLAGPGGFARTGNGNIVVSKLEVEIDPPGDAPPVPVELVRAEADYEQAGWPAAGVLKGEQGKGWAIDGNDRAKHQPRTLAVIAGSRVAVPQNSRIVVRIRQEAIDGHSIGRFRLRYAAADPALLGAGGGALSADLQAAIALPRDQRTPEQQAAISAHFRTQADGPIRRAEQTLAAAKKSTADFRAALPSAMVMREGAPRQAFVLQRGEYDKRGEKVEPALPAFLPPLPEGTPANRLALARWIVDPSHPLTSRVWVNRQWERLFGTGIVKTSENLGSQAEYPSHPQLLDWLAAEFMEPTAMPPVNGSTPARYDTKGMLKLILTSATYRQAAVVTPASVARDPENRLLSRMARIRLSGEAVRDQALGVAGFLVPTVGGPSVRPWMPEGVWDETSKYGDLRGYKADTGPGRHRRTMYTIWKRTAAPPTMLLFDAPSREICTVKRSRTNTPLQALALLNEPTFVEAAHGLAARMIAEGGATPAGRIGRGFHLALAREPTPEELDALLAGFTSDLQRFTADPASAEKYLASAPAAPPEGLSTADRAAYALSANVLMNLDEFVMRP